MESDTKRQKSKDEILSIQVPGPLLFFNARLSYLSTTPSMPSCPPYLLLLLIT